MSKFAKKEATAEAPKGKEKTWTNDPSMQEDGKTTEKGKAARKAKGMSATETEKVPGFAKGAKAAKGKAPAKGKTPPKKEAANAGPDNRKITLVTKENPKREGSASHARFELYRKAKTVQAFIDAGGTSGDIRYDEKAGHITVS